MDILDDMGVSISTQKKLKVNYSFQCLKQDLLQYFIVLNHDS